MNTFILISVPIFILIVYLGLRRIYKEIYYTNSILAEVIRMLSEINNKLKRK